MCFGVHLDAVCCADISMLINRRCYGTAQNPSA